MRLPHDPWTWGCASVAREQYSTAAAVTSDRWVHRTGALAEALDPCSLLRNVLWGHLKYRAGQITSQGGTKASMALRLLQQAVTGVRRSTLCYDFNKYEQLHGRAAA